VVVGDGAEEIITSHARRDVERWTEAAEDRLSAAALRGDLVAVLGRHIDRELGARLRADGVAVEMLAPAPCP
jgi:hypothetical protein